MVDIEPYNRGMTKITLPIEPELKSLLESHCEARGLKQQHVMNAALAAYLEDAEDLALVEERRAGPWVSWEDLKAGLDL
jgi:predicted DNA-binding protein